MNDATGGAAGSLEPRMTLGLAGSARRDEIDAWLDVFVRLLRFPEIERASVREELESHLRERVRDLLLVEADEPAAKRRAIEELGDAADLADRFVAAQKTPSRRRLMNAMVIAAAGAALVTSIVAVTNPGGQPKSAVFEPVAQHAPAPSVESHVFDKTPLRQALAVLAADSQRTLDIVDVAFEQVGVAQDAPVTARVDAGPLDAAMRRIGTSIRGRDGLLDFRVGGSSITVAPRAYFDRLESKLVSLDLTAYCRGPNASTEAVVELVTRMVEPDLWADNGGDLAQVRVVGTKAFVKAPPRVCEQIAWIVERLNEAPGAALAPGAAAAKAATGPAAADLQAERRQFLRREIAWKKVQLDMPLTAEERSWLDDQRSVRGIDANDPQRASVERLLQALQTELATMDQAFNPFGRAATSSERKTKAENEAVPGSSQGGRGRVALPGEAAAGLAASPSAAPVSAGHAASAGVSPSRAATGGAGISSGGGGGSIGGGGAQGGGTGGGGGGGAGTAPHHVMVYPGARPGPG